LQQAEKEMSNEQTNITNTIKPAPLSWWRYIGLKKIDVYIVKKFVTTFLFCIMVLAVISCVIDYSEKVDSIVAKKASFLVVLNYYKDFVPHITALLFPLFIFIATIFFTSKLAYKSEIIAILSSGVSFQRFLRPYFVGAGFLCAISLVANHWWIPNANKDRIAFEDKYINEGSTRFFANDMHLGISKGDYVYLMNYSVATNTGNHFTEEKIDGILLKEKLTADHVSYDTLKKIWHLYNGFIRTNDSVKETITKFNEKEFKYPFAPGDLNRTDAIKEALTTSELDQYVEKEKLHGRENLNFFYVEKHRRSAQPFAGFILTIIGACIASKKIRGGSGFHLALGIVISAVYIMFLQTSTTLSTKASLNPFLAVWLPNFVFAIVAYILYRRQVK
jgi:lipopolysaccharide export system permease protein